MLSLHDDLLTEVGEISEFCHGSRDKTLVRKTRHQIKIGAIPTFRMGKKICSRKSTILAAIAAKERAAADANIAA